MYVLAIDEPFDPTMTRWVEGCIFNYDRSGLWLIYFYDRPSAIEIESIQQGDAQFGLLVIGPVIFLLHQFGDIPWHDCSYSYQLVPVEDRKLPEVTDHHHALLRVVLVDTATGLTKAIRALTFSAEFTKKLHQAIHFQASLPWDKPSNEQLVQDVYDRFSTMDLVRQCKLFCRGGD